MARVFGLWYGGYSYSYGDLFTDGETWESRAGAEQSLKDRYKHGYWSRDTRGKVLNFREDGLAIIGDAATDDLRPAVTENTHIDVYPAYQEGRDENGQDLWHVVYEPIYRLSLGPRGGVVRENF